MGGSARDFGRYSVQYMTFTYFDILVVHYTATQVKAENRANCDSCQIAIHNNTTLVKAFRQFGRHIEAKFKTIQCSTKVTADEMVMCPVKQLLIYFRRASIITSVVSKLE